MTSAPPAPLWRRRPPVSRDRKHEITRDEIAQAAFAIAETENLPAVSVKRVAGRLGIPGVRLQQYLHDRADLLDLMVDVALGEIDDPPADPDPGWRDRLEHLAHALRTLVQRHPWLSGLLGLRPATGPHGLRFTERSLAAMAGTDIDIALAAQCVETVLTFVCGTVRPDALAASADGGMPPEQVATYLAEQVASDEFPLVAQMLARPSAVNAADMFTSGLSYLLTGMAADVGLEVDCSANFSRGRTG